MPSPNATTPLRVLLADDHPMIMAGFAHALTEHHDHAFEIVAQVKTPQEAIAAYHQHRPDVAVLDIRFGNEMSGLDSAKSLLQQYPQAKIIFLSQFDQDALIKETYQIGAKAFMNKNCAPDELAQAIIQAHTGENYFHPTIAERLAKLSLTRDDAPQTLLDERSLTIFTMMAEGLTNVEIADRLQLSQKTISNTSQAIKDKLGIHRPAQITKLALKHGLIQAE